MVLTNGFVALSGLMFVLCLTVDKFIWFMVDLVIFCSMCCQYIYDYFIAILKLILTDF